MRAIVVLLSGLALYGQGTLSVSPSPVFLNANLNGAPVSVTVSALSSAGTVNLTAPTVPWLTLSTLSASSPAAITFTGNPANLAAGVYNTTITFSDSSGASTTVTVALAVNTPGSPVSASPSSLVFNFAQGAGTPATQPLSITSSTAVSYSLTANASWITLSATVGQASPGNPGTASVGVNPAAVNGPGTYIGSVTITPSFGSPILAPVVFQFTSSAQLISSVSSLAFNLSASAPNNVVQKTVSVTSSGAPISFGAVGSTLTTSNGVQWLSVAPQISTTPATLTVTVNSGSLPIGTYQGSVNIGATDASGAALKIPVTLLLSSQPILDVSPTSLSFSFSAGGPAPAHQLVTPTTTVPGQAYTVAVSTNGTGNWLHAGTSGATPAPVDVFVDPTGLGTGAYTGSLTITVPNAANSPQTVAVTLAVTNNPTLTSPSATAGLTFNFEVGQNAPPLQSVSVTSSTGIPLAFSVGTTQTNTSNNVTWLLASSPASSVTPASFSVAVNPAGMTAGRYTGAVVVSTPGGSPLAIPVTLNVANAGAPLLNVSPSSITFNTTPGGGVNPQSVTVTTSGESVAFIVSGAINSPAGGTWLILSNPASPASATIPSTFFVSATTAGLPAGTYTASVTVQPANGNPAVVIPVTLNITAPNLTVSPTALTFTQTFGSAAPALQNLSVSSSGAALSFNVAVTGGSWLSVSPGAGTTPATLAVSVNGGALQPGNYTAQILLNALGAANGQQTVTVNLTVAAAQSLAVSPTVLTFNSVAGAGAPAPQTVALATSTGSLAFTAAVAVNSPPFGSWLKVSPSSGLVTVTPTSLTIAVNPQGLTAGTYNGTVTFSAPGATNTQTVNVTYTVAAIPPMPVPVPLTISNAASMQPGPVAPGEMLTIKGMNLGPLNPVSSPQVPGVTVPTLVLGTQVTFDGIPAPLLYVSATQLTVVAPYGILGHAQTQLVVSVNGVPSSPISLNVTDSAPAIFTYNLPIFPPSQGVIWNADGTVNSPQNPAARGTEIVILATGEGWTDPPGVDGLVTPLDPSAAKAPIEPVQVVIGGVAADPPDYAGSALGFVAGTFQINVAVPMSAPTGSTVGITVSVGNNSSPAVVTLAVQ
jgi:uncharacterized protein (TIGR03437 family)